MSEQTIARWQTLRTPETDEVEKHLRRTFPQSDAYRFNSASIRVRVVDERFKGMSFPERDALVEPLLCELQPATQADIVNLLTLYPGEPEESLRAQLLNAEFENPSRSLL
jgi:stress-induced morphogen